MNIIISLMLIMLQLVKFFSFENHVQYRNGYLDPSESMFMSIPGLSQSIDLESSYTSSRPDSASISSNKNAAFAFFCLNNSSI